MYYKLKGPAMTVEFKKNIFVKKNLNTKKYKFLNLFSPCYTYRTFKVLRFSLTSVSPKLQA